MTVADSPIRIRSTAKAALALTASTLPDPATKTTAVWMRVYSEFIPSRQGVTMVLLMTDWNTSDAPPMAKAAMSMTASLGMRRRMAKSRYLGSTSTVR